MMPKACCVSLVLAIVFSGLPISISAAQSTVSPQLGTHVRVQAPPLAGWRDGQLFAVDATNLVVRRRIADVWTLDSIPKGSVQALEMKEGGFGRRALIGALLGGVAGAAIGGKIGRAATLNCSCDDPGIGVIPGLAVGLVLGSVIGGVVGAKTQREQWIPVRLPLR